MKSLFKSCVLLIPLCAPLAFSQGDAHLGLHAAIGASAFRSHIALPIPPERGQYAITLKPAVSAGVGIAFAYDINSLVSVAPELQYTLYRANGRFVNKKPNETFSELNEAGVKMYSLELLILVRFSFDNIYAEVGPQVGANLDATTYINSELQRPEGKVFAFGPSIGGGVKLDGLLIGLRGYLGILEYAENTKGYPWAVQVSLTKLFF